MPGERPRVMLLETIDDAAMAELARAVETVPAWALDEPQVIAMAEVNAVHALMTRGKARVTADLIDACPALVAIARCGVGLDNVDCAAASARGIPVLNLPACNAATMAEHTIMLMLAVTRGLVAAADAVRRGDWASRARYDRDEVHGKALGVVGLGNIGRRVAVVAQALGMDVVYTDPVVRDEGFERVELDALLAKADVVTLHCQLDRKTRGLIGKARLEQMKPGAVLINAARGPLVDHAALAEALRDGALAGYGADVFEPAPPRAEEPLLALPHVVVTPHVGSLTRSTYRDICVRSVRNVVAVLRGDSPEPGCVFNEAAIHAPPPTP